MSTNLHFSHSFLLKIALLAVLFVSCKSQNKQSITEQTTIAALENRIPKLIRSDLFDTSSVNVIQLETTDESLIGSVAKLIKTDNKIFILDASGAKRLLVFDSKGRFQNSLGLSGRGPGELINILDFCVDTGEEAVVLTCSTGRIVKIDYHGKVIEERSFAALTNIISYNGNYYGYTGAHAISDDFENHQIVKLNNDLEIEQLYLPFSHPFPGLFRNINALYKHNEEVYFFSLLDNAIYQLQNDHFSMRYYFDFGSRQLCLKEASSPDLIFGNDYSFLWNYSVVGDSIIFMSVFDNGRPYIAILNKEAKTLFLVDSMDDNLPEISNPVSHSNGMFISVITSHRFLETFPSSDISPSPDDNPLLLEYRIKNIFE